MDILNAINTELTHLKSTSGNAWVGRDAQRDRAVRALTDAERRQRAGQYDSTAPAARSATDRIADADAANQARLDQQRRDDQIRQQQAAQGGYNPGYPGGGSYQGPQPVIINNTGNSNDGLLTGMMLGEMLSDRHDRVVERDVYVDRGRDRDDSFDDDRRRATSPADDGNSGLFDTGSGSDSFDDSSSVDTSNNDSFDS